MKTTHTPKRLTYSHAALRFLFVLVAVSLLSMVFPVFAQGTIDGNVYKDFNASGTRTALAGGPGTAGEPGVAGVLVTAYGASGATVGSDVTDANGDYSLTVSSADPEVRIEFSNLPTYLRSGPFGGNSTTTVTFVPVGATGVDLALADPGEYCHTNNPNIAITCYDFGPAGGVPPNNNPSVTTFPYLAGSTSQSADSGASTVTDTALATSGEVGATWGVAYNKVYGQLYVSAFTKRHVGFGPAGTGGIYVIDPANSAANPLATLITLAAGANPHDTANYLIDDSAWSQVGRVGLGDIDVSDDGRTLYAVNFATNSIQTINIGVGGRTATLGASIPSPAPCAGARLGGLKFHRGQLYYGVTCTTAPLQSFVYRAGAQVASIPLGYNRGKGSEPLAGASNCQAVPTGLNCAFWRPWAAAPFDNNIPPGTINDIPVPLLFNQEFYPQPLLMDIEFDADNFMIVGMMDRYGHQSGFPIGGSAAGGGLFANREGVSAGDILRLSPNGAGTAWTLESNGGDGRNTTIGAGNNQGPDGGEFYFHDRYELLVNNLHDEITLGGLLHLAGAGEVVTATYDPSPQGDFYTSGVIALSNTTGQRTRSAELIPANAPGTFGKAAGLGDLEPLCGPAPLEIGNRVWFDDNLNGVQDPGTAEFPYAGVTLNLYLDANCDGTGETLVGTVVTNGAGEFIFNDATIVGGLIPGVTFWDGNGDGVRQVTEPIGILPNLCYEIRIEAAGNFGPGDPLDGFDEAVQTLFVTRRGGGLGQRDNNGAERTGIVTSGLIRTGTFGENDHTWDFGFTDQIPPPPGDPGDPGEPTLSLPPNIAKSVVPPFGAPGTSHTWTIQVQNPHDRDINNVAVSDPVPSQLTVISASASAGNVSVSGQVVYWSIETMNPGQSVTITVETRVRGNVSVPFIIENTAILENGYIGTASGRILSAGGLPSTGERQRR